jgi:preprotein translocase subunit SecE
MAKTKLLGSDKEKKLKAKEKEQKQQKRKVKTPARFFKEIFSELKKVTWPTRKDLVSYTLAVIIFILIMAAITYGIDLVLNQVLLLATK